MATIDRLRIEGGAEMYIQVVTFHLEDLPEDAYRQACEQLAPAIAAVPGLISKVFLGRAKTQCHRPRGA